jgi:hypothetical protein
MTLALLVNQCSVLGVDLVVAKRCVHVAVPHWAVACSDAVHHGHAWMLSMVVL